MVSIYTLNNQGPFFHLGDVPALHESEVHRLIEATIRESPRQSPTLSFKQLGVEGGKYHVYMYIYCMYTYIYTYCQYSIYIYKYVHI